MTREARANLIFVVCLVVLSTPGFLILMSRKLGGSTKPNDLPAPVPMETAYVQPPPAPPRLPRVEPPATRAWVQKLLSSRHGPDVPMVRAGGQPVTSDRFVTQLVGLSTGTDGAWEVALLIWDDRGEVATEAIDVSSQSAGRTTPGVIRQTEAVDVPRDVRRSLQDLGYARPPEKVWWIEAALPAGSRPTTITLRRRLTADDATPETIVVPAAISAATRPAATRSTETAP